jgi:hypothetical protein
MKQKCTPLLVIVPLLLCIVSHAQNITTIVGGIGDGAAATAAELNVYSCFSFLGGGYNNKLTGDTFSSIMGGQGNHVCGRTSAVAGGENNCIAGWRSFIGGGVGNCIMTFSNYNVIAGGVTNSMVTTSNTNSCYSFIGGGKSNTISGTYSSIIGGSGNSIPSGLSNVHIAGSGITAAKPNTLYTHMINANSIPGPGGGGWPAGTIYYILSGGLKQLYVV